MLCDTVMLGGSDIYISKYIYAVPFFVVVVFTSPVNYPISRLRSHCKREANALRISSFCFLK